MNNVEKVRGKMGLTQVDVAKLINIVPQNLNSIEKRKLSSKNALKLERVLNTNAFYLMWDDVLKLKPRNEEDKKVLIDMINSL